MKKVLFAIITTIIVHAAYGQHDHKGHDHKKDTVPAKKTQKNTEKQPAKATETKTSAQHDHGNHSHGADTTKPHKQQTTSHGQEQHKHGDEGHGHETHTMSHAFSLSLPMNRNGSGTGWLPDNSPMYGYMFHKKGWMFMLHGNLFLRYNKQDLLNVGERGDSKFDAPNWAMLMGQKQVGRKGLFRFSSMISLDPLIAGGEGYPLLFQTGETYKGQPLIDRQHPHDFISELSVGYTHSISPKSDVFIYLGYPAEPAIGPVAFMHRPSALPNPDATLTHHWTDATHITFGVATLGFRHGKFKIEGSSFTGREPNEQRFDIDKPRFDSWSGRLSFNPSDKWAMQIYHGFLKEPEELHVGEDVKRTTASVNYSTRGYGATFLNFTALWGVNRKGHHEGEHGALIEGAYNTRKWSPYFRYEWVQKSSEELQLNGNEFGHHEVFPVNAFTAGLNYDLLQIGNTKLAAGGHFTFFSPDQRLSRLYGQNPLAGQIYFRIYPGAMGRKEGAFFLPY